MTAITTSRIDRVDNFLVGIDYSRLSRVDKKMKPNPAYELETEKIKVHKNQYQGVHKFKAATWTHPNGHPRCYLCGQEEPISPECNRPATKAEEDAVIASWGFKTFAPADAIEKSRRVRVGRRVGHDVSGQLRIPFGQEGGGEWVKMGSFSPLKDKEKIISARAARTQANILRMVTNRRNKTGLKLYGRNQPNMTGAKTSKVKIDPLRSTPLPRKPELTEKKAVEKWANENLPSPDMAHPSKPDDAKYAKVVAGLARRDGVTQDPSWRAKQAKENLIAQEPSLANANRHSALMKKMPVEVARLMEIENQVNAQFFPVDHGSVTRAPVTPIPLAERRLAAYGDVFRTPAQQRAILSINTRDRGIRVAPFGAQKDRQIRQPEIMVKALAGPNKGQYVRVNATGEQTVIRPEHVKWRQRESKKFWDARDAEDKARKLTSREQRVIRENSKDFVSANTADDFRKAGLDSRRARAMKNAKDSGLNEKDTFNQVNITGDKTLLAQQDSDWRYTKIGTAALKEQKALNNRLKELSVPNTEKYIKDNQTSHVDPRSDAEIRQAFKDTRKTVKEESAQLKIKHPELSKPPSAAMGGGFKPSPPIPIFANDSAKRAEFDSRQARIADLANRGDQTPTVIMRTTPSGVPRLPTKNEQASDDKKRQAAAEAATLKAATEPSSRATRTGIRRASTGPRTPREPKHEPKTFTSQEGVPLNPGTVKGKYIPQTHPKVIKYPTRPMTQTELEDLFPAKPAVPAKAATAKTPAKLAKPAVPAGTLPPNSTNFRVPKNQNTPAIFGQVKYKFDYVTMKSGEDQAKTVNTQAHSWAASERKFVRVAKMAGHMPVLDTKLKKEYKTNDTAAVVVIMRILGMRPSSESAGSILPLKDATGKTIIDPVTHKPVYGPKTVTFGATTLTRDMVTFGNSGKTVVLTLKGKSAHDISIRTNDSTIVDIFKTRMAKKGKPTDQLFKSVTAADTIDYVKSVMSDNNNKDLRTYVANEIAQQIKATMTMPETLQEFKNRIIAISEHTANQLQHGHEMSVQSYIDPMLFQDWATHIGLDWEAFFHPVKGKTRVRQVIKRMVTSDGIYRNSRKRRSSVSKRVNFWKRSNIGRREQRYAG